MKKSNSSCQSQHCLLCRLSLKEWIPAIEAHKQTYQFKRGAAIFKEGEPVKGVYFLYDGVAKVHKKWGSEKELIVRFARRGDILGHRGIGKDFIYPISATVLETITACFIDLDFFQATLKTNHELTYQLLLFYAKELQESEKNMRNLAHMPVKGRLAYALLVLLEKFGCNTEGYIDLPLSKQDLASFIGTTYETAFRMTSELIQENVIKVESKHIAIMNKPHLAQLSNEAES